MRCYVDMLLITSTANIKTWERDNGLYGGLSPLARGTWALPEWGLFCTRFIPAAAGNSRWPALLRTNSTVYPRWRGELWWSRNPRQNTGGLSPLARGTRGRRVHICLISRFIPAGAGNSNPISVGAALLTVYPRWRGELTPQGLTRNRQAGLSPLARGTL